MKTLTLAAAFCGVLALPAIAEAASGFSTANVNMRSGPSTAYPAVTLIPVGAPLRINGCLAETPWCDVSFAGGRGWVAGRYVQALYQQRRVYVDPQYYRPLGIPTITFDLDNYWDRNYRGRDFYRDRDHWAQGPNWGRNGGNPVYRQPPPAYDPQDDDQPNWQRHRPRPPAYDPDDDQGGNNPPPRFRPRYGANDGQPRYGNQPDQGNYGDDNQPRRRPPQQQDQQQQGQPPRQQPQAQQPAPPAQQPQAQQSQPQAQQPAANQQPRPIRRNDGQVVQCPDGTNNCAEQHFSHN